MTYSNIFGISAAGMDVERTRVDVATLNLANINTVSSPDKTGYRPLAVAVQSALVSANFSERFESGINMPVANVLPLAESKRLVYEPENPVADTKGYVAYPKVDQTNEMMTIMSALRAYEANVAAMNASKSMMLKALDIGGNG